MSSDQTSQSETNHATKPHVSWWLIAGVFCCIQSVLMVIALSIMNWPFSSGIIIGLSCCLVTGIAAILIGIKKRGATSSIPRKNMRLRRVDNHERH